MTETVKKINKFNKNIPNTFFEKKIGHFCREKGIAKKSRNHTVTISMVPIISHSPFQDGEADIICQLSDVISCLFLRHRSVVFCSVVWCLYCVPVLYHLSCYSFCSRSTLVSPTPSMLLFGTCTEPLLFQVFFSNILP